MTAEGSHLRDRLHQAYSCEHARRGRGQDIALIYRRDIRPLMPKVAAGPVIDIGCGQGQLVKLLLADGYDAHGADISQGQVAQFL